MPISERFPTLEPGDVLFAILHKAGRAMTQQELTSAFTRIDLGIHPNVIKNAELMVDRSLQYNLLSVAEKKKRYGKDAAHIQINPPKLRKLKIGERDLIGLADWSDDRFKKRRSSRA